MVAAIVAAATFGGVVFDRVFGRRDTAVRDLAKDFHEHEVSDATAFAEFRASLAALSRDQVGVENRLAMLIDGVRTDLRQAGTERTQMMDSLRDEVRGVNDRIDKIIGSR